MNLHSKITRTAALAAVAVLGGVGSVAAFGGSAEAIPAPQAHCARGTTSITPASGWQSLGLPVAINNGRVARRVITHLSTDMGVDELAEVRVGYSIDGGPVQEKVFGPGNLANHMDFWQTRNAMAVIPLRKGTHTVTPYWRISGSAGKAGFFEDGCFTVEGQTH